MLVKVVGYEPNVATRQILIVDEYHKKDFKIPLARKGIAFAPELAECDLNSNYTVAVPVVVNGSTRTVMADYSPKEVLFKNHVYVFNSILIGVAQKSTPYYQNWNFIDKKIRAQVIGNFINQSFMSNLNKQYGVNVFLYGEKDPFICIQLHIDVALSVKKIVPSKLGSIYAQLGEKLSDLLIDLYQINLDCLEAEKVCLGSGLEYLKLLLNNTNKFNDVIYEAVPNT